MEASYFFKPCRAYTVSEIAEHLKLPLYNSEQAKKKIFSVASLFNAQKDSAVYFANKKYRDKLGDLHAGLIFCSEKFAQDIPDNIAILLSENPYRDFVKFASLLYPDAIKLKPLCSGKNLLKSTFIDDSARLGKDVIVESGTVIGQNVDIGSGTIIAPNAVIGSDCKIGANCYIGANVTIQCAIIGDSVTFHPGCRIGQDGFGFIKDGASLLKVPQLGYVIIKNDVEIGSNTTIDRGSFENTVIGSGTKIDNLVQIAHNVKIGKNCIIAAHSGISGSVLIKDGAILGGRVGLKDHIQIGTEVQIAASSGVMHNIPDHEIWAGIPAQPIKRWLKEIAMFRAMLKNKEK